MLRNWLLGGVGLVTALALAPAADALNITGLSITTNAGNTADSLVNTGNPRSQVDSNTAITTAPSGPVADTIGSALSFQTQYSWLVAADREGPGVATTTQNATADYSISFTVDNPTGANYQIDINTLRAGALTIADDDATGGATGTATLNAVTGSMNSVIDSALGLAAVGSLSQGTTGASAFSQSGGTFTITSSALSANYILNFTWTGTASSSKDEAAIRMGIQGGLTGSTADDYPGTGARTIGGDGHFVTVNTQIIGTPEPESAALVAFGLLGLALRRKRSDA
jgi:hypothetical protein